MLGFYGENIDDIKLDLCSVDMSSHNIGTIYIYVINQ